MLSYRASHPNDHQTALNSIVFLDAIAFLEHQLKKKKNNGTNSSESLHSQPSSPSNGIDSNLSILLHSTRLLKGFPF